MEIEGVLRALELRRHAPERMRDDAATAAVSKRALAAICDEACAIEGIERSAILLPAERGAALCAVAASGLPLSAFAGCEGGPLPAAVHYALARGELAEIPGGALPAWTRELGVDSVACAPIVPPGRGSRGALFAAGGRAPLRLTPEARDRLSMLARLASAHVDPSLGATGVDLESVRLADRLTLAREIHDSVMPRLTAVLVALGSDHDPTRAEHAEYAQAIGDALSELRAILARLPTEPADTAPASPGELLAGLSIAPGRDVRVHAEPGWEACLPEGAERLVEHFLSEALANATKHGGEAPIEVRIKQKPAVVTFEVSNELPIPEAAPAREPGGLGLRLVAIHALQRGAVVGFGPKGDRHWHVRLVVPTAR
jgi:signal transduction histidine kinase